jgi:mannose-1-phosphate guanylyltransferase
MKILLLAGGQGSRLWPISTPEKPKQFHSFGQDESLLRSTFLRLQEFAPDDIYIVTLEEQKHHIKKHIPEISKDHIITLPYAHDSAMGIAYGVHALRDFPNETLVFLPSDHIISPPGAFCSFLKHAEIINQKYQEYLITVGISPTSPSSQFGYIHCEERVFDLSGTNAVFKVQAFLEKPEESVAKKLLETKHVLWNAGFVIGTQKKLFKTYEKFGQEYLESLKNLEAFKNAPLLSFDYVIWEKMKGSTLCIPSNHQFSWNDVGIWESIPDLEKKQKTVCVSSSGEIVSPKELKNTAYSASGKNILTLGLEDIVVIEGEEGILVAKKENLSYIKRGIKKITE